MNQECKFDVKVLQKIKFHEDDGYIWINMKYFYNYFPLFMGLILH